MAQTNRMCFRIIIEQRKEELLIKRVSLPVVASQLYYYMVWIVKSATKGITCDKHACMGHGWMILLVLSWSSTQFFLLSIHLRFTVYQVCSLSMNERSYPFPIQGKDVLHQKRFLIKMSQASQKFYCSCFTKRNLFSI